MITEQDKKEISMKKICLYSLTVLLLLAMVGCTCGQKATTSTGPENPNFTVVTDAAKTAEILAYFQAHTGYLPAVISIDDAALSELSESRTAEGLSVERADLLTALTEGATCLLLTDESLVAEYEALGFSVNNEALRSMSPSYRIDNADILGLTVVQMPQSSEINRDALVSLVAWMTGSEAQYLASHPDLLN